MADLATKVVKPNLPTPPVTPPGCSPQPAIPANAVNPNRAWAHYLANITPQANLE